MALAREFPDFPVTLETYRDCLEDSLDLGALEQVLGDIQSGRIKVSYVASRAPSPVARSLNYAFTNVYLYEWDTPKAERAVSAFQIDRAALAGLVKDPAFAGLLRPEAIEQVVAEVSRTAPGYRARTAVELARLLEEAGDLDLDEIRARCEGDAPKWLAELEARGLVRGVDVGSGPRRAGERRWVATSGGSAGHAAELDTVRRGQDADAAADALVALLPMFLGSHGPVRSEDVAARYGVSVKLAERALARLESDEAVMSGRFAREGAALLWASPDIVARIQARTLAILRREVRPVSVSRYAAVVRWRQGIGPRAPGDEAGADGPTADRDEITSRAREALQKLRGVALPYSVWDRIVLPARVGPSFGDAVEAAFRSGDHVWLAVSDGAGRRSVVVFPRASGRLYLRQDVDDEARLDGLAGPARRVWEFLKGEGTATSADIRAALRDLAVSQVVSALAEIVGWGLATADSWRVLRSLPARHSVADGNPVHGAAASGSAVLGRGAAHGGRPGGRHGRAAYSEARRAAARAIREGAAALPPEVRWSVATRFAVMGEPRSDTDRARARAAALGERYGVVTRQALGNESSEWAWGPIVSELSLMELRGTVRRGYFVAGLPGLQFASSDAIEQLRGGVGEEGRSGSADGKDRIELVNAADPAFALDRALIESTSDSAGVSPGLLSSVSRVPSTWVAFAGDYPVLVAEDDGRRIRAEPEERWRSSVAAAVRGLRDVLARSEPRIVVESWNGEPAAGSGGADALRDSGFRKDYPGMVFDPLQARLEGLHQIRPA